MDIEDIKKEFPEIPIGARAEDLSGKIFGHWKVLYRTTNSSNKLTRWVCQCDCEQHTVRPVNAKSLKSGTSTNCGCQRLLTIQNKSETIFREYDSSHNLIKKRCNCCKKMLPISYFWKNKAQFDGYTGKCKECSSYALKENKYSAYKKNAKKRNLDFLLTKEEFYQLIKQPCIYCGNSNGETRGIDRVNSAYGYTLENSVPCCEVCNRMKLDYPKDFWFNHMKQILKYNGELHE